MAVSVEEQTQRQAVRVVHPIGIGASPFENQLTEANRDALSQCLHQYYHHDLIPGGTGRYEPGRSSGLRDSASGVELANRVTSHLEIGNALCELEKHRRDLHKVVVSFYDDDRPKADIDQDNHWRHGEAAKRIEAALDWLIPIVFFDVTIPPPKTRGK